MILEHVFRADTMWSSQPKPKSNCCFNACGLLAFVKITFIVFIGDVLQLRKSPDAIVFTSHCKIKPCGSTALRRRRALASLSSMRYCFFHMIESCGLVILFQQYIALVSQFACEEIICELTDMTKDTADVRTLSAVMRTCLGTSYELEQIPDTYDGVAEKWHVLLRQLLMRTPRLNVKAVAAAAHLAFELPLARGLPWARALVDCVSYCRQKNKSATSGKKLSAAVFSIVTQLASTERRSPRRLWPGGVRSANALRSPKRKSPEDAAAPLAPKYDAKAIADMYRINVACVTPTRRTCQDAASEDISPGGNSSCIVVSSQSSVDAPAPPSLRYLDSQQLSMVQVKDNGESESAKLVPGPNGFATATFRDGHTCESECPNLLLTLPLKRPAAAKKRPAAVMAETDSVSCSYSESEKMDTPKSVKKKPAAAAAPGKSKKRPPASATPAVSSSDGKKPKYTSKPENALELRPGGCSRCRHAPGCTPSCWLKRPLPLV